MCDLMDLMEFLLLRFWTSRLFFFYCFPGIPYRKEGYGEQLITHSHFLPWCALLCVLLIDWPVVMDRLAVGTSQYCQVSVFLGERGGRRRMVGERKKEREGKILIRRRVHRIPSLPDLPNCRHHHRSAPLMSIPLSRLLPAFLTSLSFCLSPVWICACVCERSCFLCVCLSCR